MRFDRARRHAVGRQPLAQPSGVVGQHGVGGIGREKRGVVSRALRLIAARHLQGAVESVGMRPRQHRERRQLLRIFVGQRPADAAAPVVPGEMKAAVAMARGRHDRHRIVHQAVDVIIRGLSRIRPRARRIAALARRDRAIAGRRQRLDLRLPAPHRFRKAVQQQHQRRIGRTRDQGVEGEGGGKGDPGEGGHGRFPSADGGDADRAPSPVIRREHSSGFVRLLHLSSGYPARASSAIVSPGRCCRGAGPGSASAGIVEN